MKFQVANGARIGMVSNNRSFRQPSCPRQDCWSNCFKRAELFMGNMAVSVFRGHEIIATDAAGCRRC